MYYLEFLILCFYRLYQQTDRRHFHCRFPCRKLEAKIPSPLSVQCDERFAQFPVNCKTHWYSMFYKLK